MLTATGRGAVSVGESDPIRAIEQVVLVVLFPIDMPGDHIHGGFAVLQKVIHHLRWSRHPIHRSFIVAGPQRTALFRRPAATRGIMDRVELRGISFRRHLVVHRVLRFIVHFPVTWVVKKYAGIL